MTFFSKSLKHFDFFCVINIVEMYNRNKEKHHSQKNKKYEKIFNILNYQSMKKVFLLMAIFAFSNAIFAQTEKVDSRVVEVFGQEKVDYWQNNQPDSVTYYNFLVNYGFKIEPIPAEKADFFWTVVAELPLKSQFRNEKSDFSASGLKKLNVLKYDFEINPLQINYYRLGNTGKIIIFYSAPDIEKMIREAKTTLE